MVPVDESARVDLPEPAGDRFRIEGARREDPQKNAAQRAEIAPLKHGEPAPAISLAVAGLGENDPFALQHAGALFVDLHGDPAFGVVETARGALQVFAIEIVFEVVFKIVVQIIIDLVVQIVIDFIVDVVVDLVVHVVVDLVVEIVVHIVVDVLRHGDGEERRAGDGAQTGREDGGGEKADEVSHGLLR